MIIGFLDLTSGARISDIFAPGAVSWCPPTAWLITPSDLVITLTLKSVSISSAPSSTKSRVLTAGVGLFGFA